MVWVRGGGGFEPPTFGLWARRATGLLHPAPHCDQTVPVRSNGSWSVGPPRVGRAAPGHPEAAQVRKVRAAEQAAFGGPSPGCGAGRVDPIQSLRRGTRASIEPGWPRDVAFTDGRRHYVADRQPVGFRKMRPICRIFSWAALCRQRCSRWCTTGSQSRAPPSPIPETQPDPTRAAGAQFKRTLYRRFAAQAVCAAPLPSVPADYDQQLKRLRRRLRLT